MLSEPSVQSVHLAPQRPGLGNVDFLRKDAEMATNLNQNAKIP